MKRTVTATAICATALSLAVLAQVPAPRMLPLDNLGLEHLDIIVPDPAASARFYARVFKTALHQQPVRDTLRYFVLLGDLPQDRQVGYIAIGASGDRAPHIGHYCVLAKVYQRAGFASALEAAGRLRWPRAPGHRCGRPDGLNCSSYSPPPAWDAAEVAAAVEGEGSSLRSHGSRAAARLESRAVLPYYRQVYGQSAERPRDANGRVWFHLAGGTRIGLQQIADGRKPSIGHFAVKVAPFDRTALMARLRELSAEVLTSGDEPDVVRFRDNNGIIVELRVA